MSRVSTNLSGELSPRAAEVRLAQYGERTKTWSTATYESGAEKALHEIALCLLEEVKRLRAEAERDVRWQIARDFEKYSRVAENLSWGEAYYIARDGLCTCRGGDKPCDAVDIRELVEGGESL
ncbi:hypothetical protein [Streptomyces wuyuanensis]|uniref:Uncharacterized protein n=1 Tax=Streptomyces wuyuanensis TaxID=1196353 RepID=A0A1G9ZCU7_9ACTN|nr:hypothetical protein [Streptomyces wuyuanensis]SDN19094.1 hypothetical protein SAMN05444921_12189 [Streptomyces wuyuanensis]